MGGQGASAHGRPRQSRKDQVREHGRGRRARRDRGDHGDARCRRNRQNPDGEADQVGAGRGEAPDRERGLLRDQRSIAPPRPVVDGQPFRRHGHRRSGRRIIPSRSPSISWTPPSATRRSSGANSRLRPGSTPGYRKAFPAHRRRRVRSVLHNTARSWSRSIRWSSRPTEALSPPTRRWNSTTTRSSATRSLRSGKKRCRSTKTRRWPPKRVSGIRNFRRFDGTVGTMANGAGLAMGTMDAVQQRGRQDRQLSRRRRRRERRARPQLLRAGRQPHRRQGVLHQHLRRHHARRRSGQGHRRSAGNDDLAQDSARHPADRHERRRRPQDSGRQRA